MKLLDPTFMTGQGRILCTLGAYTLFFTLKLIATCDGLSYFNHEPTLASVLSFGIMLILTNYLVVVTLKLNRKRIPSRVNSCI